jgi:hypothetical protein
MATDLEGPLTDFFERTTQIRRIIVAIESAGKSAGALTTVRGGIDLKGLGLETGNTVNAMSMVFLASSFEEFVREELSLCAEQVATYYPKFADDVRHGVRNAYWAACLDTFRFTSSILTKQKPRTPDVATIAKLKSLLDSARGFVVGDDAALLDKKVLIHHMHNFRPSVVDELAGRLGIKSLISDSCDSNKLRAKFGLTRKHEVEKTVRAKLNEFYERRNSIVHSLSSASGYAVDVVIDYIELFEAVADSMKTVLVKTTAKWAV